MKYLFLFMSITLAFSGCQSKYGTGQVVPYANWESNSVISNGIRIHYWRTDGQGKPVMIMAHGITDYGLNWASLAAKFQDDYDIVMYDARGHGFSEKPDGPYSLDANVKDLVGLIEVLKIDKPILIGHSMGGCTVAAVGADYPDLPAAIIMEDPVFPESLEYLNEDILPDWKAMVDSDRRTDKQELMKIARTIRHKGLSDFEYDHWAESKLLVTPNVIDIVRGESFGDPIKIYPKIKAPTLILKADADKESRKEHLKVAGLLPNGKLVHIDGTSHQVRMDKPVETERQIRIFLDGLN